MCRSLLTIWRRQYRNGELGAPRPVSFTSVAVTKDIAASQPGPVDLPDLSRNSQVEIALPNGRRLIVPIMVDPEALARILSVVDRQ